MVDYVTRSEWGGREPEGRNSLVPGEVENTAFHWPGMSKPINANGPDGFRRVCSALRGWQRYHMDGRGWSDIAYQIAIDQAGRAYTLRGINIRSGANGNGDVNRRFGAILLILGPGEKPSAAMKATARAVLMDYRKRFSRMPRRPTWHGKIRPGGTTCPGPITVDAIQDGEFDAGITTTPPPPSKDWFDMATEAQLESLLKRIVPSIVRTEIREYFRDELFNLKANGTAAKNHQEVEGLLRGLPEAVSKKVANIQIVDPYAEKNPDGSMPTKALSSHVAYGPERVAGQVVQALKAEEQSEPTEPSE